MRVGGTTAETTAGAQARGDEPLVSVVIACYNQAHFLGEAIESVLAQTYPHFEVVVINDGSKDNPAEVVARHPGARLIDQENQGRCAARNAGARASRGSYLLFLDADDRLLPNALEAGVNCLGARPECAFAYGHYRHIAADGAPLPTGAQHQVDEDHYAALLRTNIINMLATVMFRRDVFLSAGGFDTSLTGAEDYDLYFRITRKYPVCRHEAVVAEYRKHGANTTANTRVMQRDTFAVMRAQWEYIKGNKRYEEAYKTGMRRWRDHWGNQYVDELRAHVRARRQWKQAIRGGLTVLRYYPRGFVVHAFRKLYCLIFRVKSDFAS